MKAKIARFYGWTDSEISRLPYKKFLDYWNAITNLEATELIQAIQASSFSDLKKPDKTKMINKLERQAKENFEGNPDGLKPNLEKLVSLYSGGNEVGGTNTNSDKA